MGICQSKDDVQICQKFPVCINSGTFGCFVENNTNTKTFIDNLQISEIRVHNGQCDVLGQLESTIVDDSLKDRFLTYIKENINAFKVMFTKSEDDSYSFVKEVKEIKNVLSYIDANSTTISILDFGETIPINDKYFAIELDLTTQIQYSLIVKGKSKNYSGNTIYLICQNYCKNGALDHILEQEHILEAKEILSIYNDLYPVLAKLHSNNYIHNDIKPANVVKCGEIYKFIDFGLSCYAKSCMENKLNGTPAYRIPALRELSKQYPNKTITFGNDNLSLSLLGEKATQVINTKDSYKIMKKNDEYALGITLFMCLPDVIEKESEYAVIIQIIHDLCDPNKFLKTSQGGAEKLKKTQDRVYIKGVGHRVVFTGKYGKKFIKYNGDYTPLSKVRKLVAKKK